MSKHELLQEALAMLHLDGYMDAKIVESGSSIVLTLTGEHLVMVVPATYLVNRKPTGFEIFNVSVRRVQRRYMQPEGEQYEYLKDSDTKKEVCDSVHELRECLAERRIGVLEAEQPRSNGQDPEQGRA